MENQISKPKDQLGIKSYQAVFITRVYNWMALALFITGLIAYYTASNPQLFNAIVSSRLLFFGLIIGELALVVYLSRAINTMSRNMAIGAFLVYSVLNGLTMSVIFMAYTSSSIATTFYITAGTFAAMSVYGYTTKRDLTSIGNMAFMALIGIIIASIVNMFLQNEMMYWIISYLGVAIFVGLVAYDTQKLKEIGSRGFVNEEGMEKSAILGALSLYLDFINLFLFLLRIFGDRR
ncbi:Bax inhibitor-1/YccA family protein [Lutimonas zeaxanthinifaciens]|uniref:Bax inhibitor-1/YccA family protein n=1 Tax=Lutimonas zeaxanthinifaciens TaxID=3060215 RepID=UPI00265D2BCE|nr:Bax inhibitor-1/YccA family protein [Lutimonas sp. YSD2104]WKK65548.1 Bax inhibitor-1/YccA family protein [Lutimonas sp. YSD2104]